MSIKYIKTNPDCYTIQDHVDNVMGEFMMDVDGFFYFFPSEKSGLKHRISYDMMLTLGNKLKEINEPLKRFNFTK
jgi:hypothetical protein